MNKKNDKNYKKCEFLTMLYHDLMAFYANSHSPRNIDDVKGEWIVDKEETEAMKKVLDMLEDCGAQTEIPNSFIK